MTSIDENTIKLIKEKFNTHISELKLDDLDRLYITIDADIVLDFANYVSADLGFDHANFCMGTDLDDKIEVSWYVGNINYSTILVIRAYLDHASPQVHSLRHIWNGFEWHERETYEMIGINFINHGDLRRLILPETWEGFPLRNDYVYKKPSYRKPEDELMS